MDRIRAEDSLWATDEFAYGKCGRGKRVMFCRWARACWATTQTTAVRCEFRVEEATPRMLQAPACDRASIAL